MLAAYHEKVIMVNDQLPHLLSSISCKSDSPLKGSANDAHGRIECHLSSVQFSHSVVADFLRTSVLGHNLSDSTDGLLRRGKEGDRTLEVFATKTSLSEH